MARRARFPKLGSKPVDSNASPRFYHSATGKPAPASKFKRLWITIVIVYIFPLNGYRELDSYEEPCIHANGNAITSFARELNPTGVGEHIYIYCHPQTDLFRSIRTHQCGYIYIMKTLLAFELKIDCIRNTNTGGIRGVMVIVVENGHDDTSSNPGRDWLHFT